MYDLPRAVNRMNQRRLGQGRARNWWTVASREAPTQPGPLHPTPAERPLADRHFGLLVSPYQAGNDPGQTVP